jgi:hypothetical protein
MIAPRHLVAVWNPAYASDAMDAHLATLLEWAAKGDPDETYVWWGKLRSAKRQQPLPHTADVLALHEQIEQEIETHLYLTDYRSLYVAHLDEVTAEDVMADSPDEQAHAPAYYRKQGAADFWFRLLDIRRLVADDTLETVAVLQGLRNVHYNDRPVSLYGGMVNLPLVVKAESTHAWFADTEQLTDGRMWAERDAELRSEVPRLARELRDNLIGRTLWSVLEPGTRTFLATAEAVFRPHQDDPRFNFSSPAVEYAKAVESELNALLFPVLDRTLKDKDRILYLDGKPLNVGGRVPHQSLGVLRYLLEDDAVRRALRAAVPQHGNWLTGILPTRLQILADLRNAAAHSASTAREQVSGAREEILGIGQEGLVVQIARAKMRA